MKDIHDVITHAKFGDDRLRGSGVVAGQINQIVGSNSLQYNSCQKWVPLRMHTRPLRMREVARSVKVALNVLLQSFLSTSMF